MLADLGRPNGGRYCCREERERAEEMLARAQAREAEAEARIAGRGRARGGCRAGDGAVKVCAHAPQAISCSSGDESACMQVVRVKPRCC